MPKPPPALDFNFIETKFKDDKCSFCGRIPPQVETMIGGKFRICNHCINEFYKLLHNKRNET